MLILCSFCFSLNNPNCYSSVNCDIIVQILDRKDDENGGYAQWHNVGKDLMVLDFGNTNHCANVAAFDFGWLLLFSYNT